MASTAIYANVSERWLWRKLLRASQQCLMALLAYLSQSKSNEQSAMAHKPALKTDKVRHCQDLDWQWCCMQWPSLCCVHVSGWCHGRQTKWRCKCDGHSWAYQHPGSQQWCSQVCTGENRWQAEKGMRSFSVLPLCRPRNCSHCLSY